MLSKKSYLRQSQISSTHESQRRVKVSGAGTQPFSKESGLADDPHKLDKMHTSVLQTI